MIRYELLFANYSNKLGLSKVILEISIYVLLFIRKQLTYVFIKRVLLLFEID